MSRVTLKEKEELVRKAKKNGITLNGEPAIITNVKNKIPTIRSKIENNKEYTFNWKTIQDIIENNNGQFTY